MLAGTRLQFLICTCGAFLSLATSSAQAQSVTVLYGNATYCTLNTLYTIQYTSVTTSFAANSSTLTNTSIALWWGSKATADYFANLAQQINPTTPNNIWLFAYQYSGGVSNVVYDYYNSGGTLANGTSNTSTNNGYAYVASTAIAPEINGDAAGRGALLLLCLYILLQPSRSINPNVKYE